MKESIQGTPVDELNAHDVEQLKATISLGGEVQIEGANAKGEVCWLYAEDGEYCIRKQGRLTPNHYMPDRDEELALFAFIGFLVTP